MPHKVGWLVNDTLTCIPETKTLWHDLLEWLPGLVDKTGGLTDYANLAQAIESEAKNDPPDYIIRNATFFRPMNIASLTISLVQDIYSGAARDQQREVIHKSDIVVCNSEYTHQEYKKEIADKECHVIPLGTDFNFFQKEDSSECQRELQIKPNSIVYVGSSLVYPKGFDTVLDLIKNTDYNFVLVMKDGYTSSHPRVKVFNKVSHLVLRKIYSACSLLICPSKQETLHLAGIEAAACGLPLVTTNVGAYHGLESGDWGIRTEANLFSKAIAEIMRSPGAYLPREYFYGSFSQEMCRQKWQEVIKSIDWSKHG